MSVLFYHIDLMELLEGDIALLQNIELDKSWKQWQEEVLNCTQFLLNAKETSDHRENGTPAASVIVLHCLDGSQLPELGTNFWSSRVFMTAAT